MSSDFMQASEDQQFGYLTAIDIRSVAVGIHPKEYLH